MSVSLKEKLQQARVARLATVDESGRPHLVPVCFVYDGRCFYTPLDLKPKRMPPERLARVRNICANPNVALLIDEYREDWGSLWYVLVRGTAALLGPGPEHAEAQRLLKEKYPPYAGGLLPENLPLIRITPAKIVSWGNP